MPIDCVEGFGHVEACQEDGFVFIVGRSFEVELDCEHLLGGPLPGWKAACYAGMNFFFLPYILMRTPVAKILQKSVMIIIGRMFSILPLFLPIFLERDEEGRVGFAGELTGQKGVVHKFCV